MPGSAVTSAFMEPGLFVKIFVLFVRFITFFNVDSDANDNWQVLLLPFSDDNICALSCILLR